MTKRGIVLFNLGGPRTTKDVKPFLYKLFSDPAILVGIPTPIRQMIAFTIAQVKGPSSIKTYEMIGGGSPQLRWTQSQAQALDKNLKDAGQSVRVVIGMRASSPTIEEGLEQLKKWGAEEVIFFPLFPQYSTTTTGSCMTEAKRVLSKLNWKPKVTEIMRWPDHPLYISLLRKTVDEAIEQAKEETGDQKLHILFSAHSLPMKIIERGDPYPTDIQKTMKGVTEGLTYDWSLAFQSRNGKMPWLEPYTEDELQRLGKAGVKNIVVVAISFVSDHIETLFELDRLYKDVAIESGIKGYFRARAFNDDPEFGKVLSTVFQENAPL